MDENNVIRNNFEISQSNKENKPQIYDVFIEEYKKDLENITTFEEFLLFLDQLKSEGKFGENSFPFSPNDYINLKNYVKGRIKESKWDGFEERNSSDNDRRETSGDAIDAESQEQFRRGRLGLYGNYNNRIGSNVLSLSGEVGESGRIRTGVQSSRERVQSNRGGNKESEEIRESRNRNETTTKGSGDRVLSDGNDISGLTPTQQKFIKEQTDAYDQQIESARKEYEDAKKVRKEELDKYYREKGLFADETSQSNLYAEEGAPDLSDENASRIFKKYSYDVKAAKDKYDKLRNERQNFIDKITKQAVAQTEIAFDTEPAQTGKSIEERLADVGGDVIAFSDNVTKGAEIKSEEAKVDTNPSDAQKEAGNYKKGHVTVQGFDISIEQPKGSVCSGTDENGKTWSQEMKNTYGYIRGTEGKDGDHIDVFLGDNPSSEKVFVVDQLNPNTGLFDEHKAMIGFNSIEEAKDAYMSNYEDGWKGFGAITETTTDAFREWSKTEGRRIKPFSEYKASQSKESGINLHFVGEKGAELEDANRHFDKELDDFKNGKHKGLLHLGKPQEILTAAGVDAKELTLSPSLLNRKLKQHGLTTEDLKGLALAIQNPMFVYRHGSKAPNIIIVTETDARGKKLSVAMELDKNGNVVEVNNISSIHGKEAAKELERLSETESFIPKWVSDKEKVLNWLGIAHLEAGSHTDNSKHFSLAKVIRDFEKSKIVRSKKRFRSRSKRKIRCFD